MARRVNALSMQSSLLRVDRIAAADGLDFLLGLYSSSVSLRFLGVLWLKSETVAGMVKDKHFETPLPLNTDEVNASISFRYM